MQNPLLFLAGEPGLRPSSRCSKCWHNSNLQQKIHLIYGVTRDLDLGLVDQLEAFTGKLPNFTYATVVADDATNHPRKGWVTQHMPQDMLNGGHIDVYLCGPPPMVDAVRSYFDDKGVKPNSFYYEKFTPNSTTKVAA